MKITKLCLLASLALPFVGSAEAVMITINSGSENYGGASAVLPTPDVEASVINTFLAGNPSPWLDPINVSVFDSSGPADSYATASMNPSFISSSTGATYAMGVTSLAAGYGVAEVISDFYFSIDAPISFSVLGNLAGTMDGGGRVFMEGFLQSGVDTLMEYEFQTNINGAYDFTIGDGTVESTEGEVDGLLSGILPAGDYWLHLEHELFDGSGGPGSSGTGVFSLVLGDGGAAVVVTGPTTVPDGGVTVLMMGLALSGIGFCKRKAKPSAA